MQTAIVLSGIIGLGLLAARSANMLKIRLFYSGGPKDGAVEEMWGRLPPHHEWVPHASNQGAWYYERLGDARMHEGAVEVRMQMVTVVPWGAAKPCKPVGDQHPVVPKD